MKRLSLCVALLLSPTALAESVAIIGSTGIDLKTLGPSSAGDADLRIGSLVIEARYGVRLADSRQQFSNTHPVVIGRPYLVRDAKGAEVRFWIRAISGDKKWIELQPPREANNEQERPLEGTFSVVTAKENGERVEPEGYPELALKADGSYRLGRQSGKYSVSDRVLQLAGYERWGKGELTDDGDRIVFRFDRQGRQFELELRRASGPLASGAR